MQKFNKRLKNAFVEVRKIVRAMEASDFQSLVVRLTNVNDVSRQRKKLLVALRYLLRRYQRTRTCSYFVPAFYMRYHCIILRTSHLFIDLMQLYSHDSMIGKRSD